MMARKGVVTMFVYSTMTHKNVDIGVTIHACKFMHLLKYIIYKQL